VKRGSTALLALVVVGTLVATTCAGVGVCLGLLTHWQEQALLEDPAAIRTAGEVIAPLDIPPELAPVGGMRMDLPFTETPLVYLATYEGTEPLRYLILFAIRKDAVTDTDALREQIDRTLRSTIASAGTDLVVDREWTDTVLVRGAPVAFRFRHSTNADHTADVTDASGMFDGAFGPASVVYVTVGAFDETAFRAMFK
jgi:hypothetical protein